MKKIFVVKRIDEVDWDEYDSAVFLAENEAEVISIIESGECSYWDTGFREIIEIDLNSAESKELLSSFNAG